MQNMSGGKTALGLDQNIGALVCYVGNFLCLPLGLIYSIIVLVQDKTNKLPRFHAFQSILLSATALVVIVGLEIFGAIVALVTRSAILGGLIYLVVMVVALAILAGLVFAAVKAFQGQLFKLPIIGDMADKWSN